MHRLSSYYRPKALGALDRRQWEARLLRDFTADLVAHLGGSPTVAQRVLIDRAAQLQLRLTIMDRDFAATGTMSEHASRTYLAWSNSLSRTLALLGLEAVRAAPARDIFAEIREQAAKPPVRGQQRPHKAARAAEGAAA